MASMQEDSAGGVGKVVAVVLVLLLVAGGLWWWLRPAPVAQNVVFVGDSVTFMSLDDLKAAVGTKHPELIARIGYRSSDIYPLFEKQVRALRADNKPLKQAVVLIGYNDVLKGPVTNPGLGKLMDLANQFDCAVWFTIPPVPLRDQLTDEWNTRVREAAKSHHNVHVVDDWRNVVMHAKAGELITRKDGVHPTKAGAARLTKVFETAIHHAC
jgi:hypothetical protein